MNKHFPLAQKTKFSSIAISTFVFSCTLFASYNEQLYAAEKIKPLYEAWYENSARKPYDASTNIAKPLDPAYAAIPPLPKIQPVPLDSTSSFIVITEESIEEMPINEESKEEAKTSANPKNEPMKKGTEANNHTSVEPKTEQKLPTTHKEPEQNKTQTDKTVQNTLDNAQTEYYDNELRILRTEDNTAEAREAARLRELDSMTQENTSRSIPIVTGSTSQNPTINQPILIDPEYIEIN